jgi:hypothetical protein
LFYSRTLQNLTPAPPGDRHHKPGQPGRYRLNDDSEKHRKQTLSEPARSLTIWPVASIFR